MSLARVWFRAMAITAQDQVPPGPWRTLGALDVRIWGRAAAFAAVATLVIAIPTRLIPNDFFRRMTPTRPLDYVFWVVGSVLIGLALALRSRAPSSADAKVAAGGAGTILAVGCPVCNKVVVAVLGVSGALEIFAPLQPLLGVASVVALVAVLRSRLRALQATCVLAPGVESESQSSAPAD